MENKTCSMRNKEKHIENFYKKIQNVKIILPKPA